MRLSSTVSEKPNLVIVPSSPALHLMKVRSFHLFHSKIAAFGLARTHQFLAANDKTNLSPRCFKQAAKNLFV